ncbi:PucR family transcriptional regulator [Corynebacterium alimapuense]|uniref:PucR family transcriptional regulator n=1 Tax=Corynebacterium alimapuense TaxID=1576874 RepID=A0A3M8K7T1_9CORY|nr:PucR family transcriptional regulator ligand-binding domain-containing protein [Corynebacterium alimapuense]RNE48574.1 PucR family transcriptional regulator [Corynebacterium alimapuense]
MSEIFVPAEELSLTWLYRQRSLNLRPLLRGYDSFSVVQPSELVETVEFVHSGAIILTVGVALDYRPGAIEDYVHRLGDAGVVAIGFGTGMIVDRVPPRLIDAARHQGLSVFEVPRETPFVSILSVAQEELALRRLRGQQRLLEVQEVLNQVAVDRGVGDLVATTAEHLGASIMITDNDGRVVTHISQGDDRTFLSGIVEKSIAEKGRSSAFRMAGRYVLIHRMIGEGERYHLLVAVGSRPFESPERSVIKHCAGLAAIILQRPDSLRRATSELNTLAMSVLLGTDNSQQAMADVFATASDSAGRVRPVVVSADNSRSFNRANMLLDHHLADDGRQMFALSLGDNSALMLFRGSRSVPEIISLFGQGVEHTRISLGNPVRWQDLRMRIVEDLAAVAETLQPGQHAGPESRTLRWLDDTAVRGALATRFNETYQRLFDYDQESGVVLAQTLDIYLRSGGKISTTADRLGIHRHTVRSRLATAERICEVDLSDPVACAELLLLSLGESRTWRDSAQHR